MTSQFLSVGFCFCSLPEGFQNLLRPFGETEFRLNDGANNHGANNHGANNHGANNEADKTKVQQD